MIHWGLWKKFKSDSTYKWDMHSPESILENETHKLLWDYEIQTNHLFLTRRPDLLIVNKQRKREHAELVDFAIPPDHGIKLKENEKRDKYLDFTRELKKWNMKVIVIPVVIGVLGTIPKWLVKWLEVLEIRGQVKTFQTTALTSDSVDTESSLLCDCQFSAYTIMKPSGSHAMSIPLHIV